MRTVSISLARLVTAITLHPPRRCRRAKAGGEFRREKG